MFQTHQINFGFNNHHQVGVNQQKEGDYCGTTYRPYHSNNEVNVSKISNQVNNIKNQTTSLLNEKNNRQGDSSSCGRSHTFSPFFFSYTSVGIGNTYVNNGRRKDDSNVLLRVIAGVVGTVGLFIGADSIGSDFARISKCDSLSRNAGRIQSEIMGKNDSGVKRIASELAAKSKSLANRISTHTMKVNVIPKVMMVAGCALGIIGAVINAPAMLGLGLVVGVAGGAGKLFSAKAFSGEEEAIKDKANEVLRAVNDLERVKA